MTTCNYLKPADIEGHTEFEIQSMALEFVEDDAKDRFVIRFRGHEKALVVDDANAQTIQEIYGEEMDDWIGEKIVLSSTMHGIRVTHQQGRLF